MATSKRTKSGAKRRKEVSMSEPIKILSIEGGGIRGIIPAMILAEIERRTRKPVATLFDLIAGTSTGGILALGVTKPGEAVYRTVQPIKMPMPIKDKRNPKNTAQSIQFLCESYCLRASSNRCRSVTKSSRNFFRSCAPFVSSSCI